MRYTRRPQQRLFAVNNDGRLLDPCPTRSRNGSSGGLAGLLCGSGSPTCACVGYVATASSALPRDPLTYEEATQQSELWEAPTAAEVGSILGMNTLDFSIKPGRMMVYKTKYNAGRCFERGKAQLVA